MRHLYNIQRIQCLHHISHLQHISGAVKRFYNCSIPSSAVENPRTAPAVDMDNSGSGPLKVPGFGLPISFQVNEDGKSESFAIGAAANFTAHRMAKREVAMICFMESITEKPDWSRKVHDDAIIEKWRAEAKEFPDGMMSDETFQWCIEELQDRAKTYESGGIMWVSALESAARVVKADGLISEALRCDLQNAVLPLFDSEPKDWQPRSDGKVLNLVHPSLFPLVYGKTRVLVNGGKVGLTDCLASCGEGVPGKPDQDVTKAGMRCPPEIPKTPGVVWGVPTSKWSKRFQWLPADVDFRGDTGTDVEIKSYINNLYPPKHEKLYGIIEEFISKAMPLWNHVLVRGWYGRVTLRINDQQAEVDIPEPKLLQELREITPEVLRDSREYLAVPEDPNRKFASWQRYSPMPEDWETMEGLDIDVLSEGLR